MWSGSPFRDRVQGLLQISEVGAIATRPNPDLPEPISVRRILDHRRHHTSAPLPGATFSLCLSFSKVSLTTRSPHPRKASQLLLCFAALRLPLVAFPWSCAVSPQRPFEGSQPVHSHRPHPQALCPKSMESGLVIRGPRSEGVAAASCPGRAAWLQAPTSLVAAAAFPEGDAFSIKPSRPCW